MNENPTTTTAKPRRRWLRFSLRTFFIVITLLCIWLGFKVNAVRRQREAVAVFSGSSGSIYFDYQMKTSLNGQFPSNYETSPPGPVWLRKLLGNDFFCTAVAANFDNRIVNEADLSQLAKLPSLTSIRSFETAIVPTGMVPRTGAMRSVQDCDLVYLQSLTNLEYLDLNESAVTDAGLKYLKGLKKLKELGLARTKVTSEGIRQLQRSLPTTKIFGP